MFFGCIVEEFLVYIFFTEESSKTCKQTGNWRRWKGDHEKEEEERGGGCKEVAKTWKISTYVHTFVSFLEPTIQPPSSPAYPHLPSSFCRLRKNTPKSLFHGPPCQRGFRYDLH